MSSTSIELSQLPWMRSLIGKRFRLKSDVHRTQSYQPGHGIQFSLGVGDLNPLYLDQKYAESSVRGSFAPAPTWVGSVIRPMQGVAVSYKADGLGLGGVEFESFEPSPPSEDEDGWIDNLRAFNGGVGWTFIESPSLGDTFIVEGCVTQVEEKMSRAFGPIAVVRSELEYLNQDRVLLARVFPRAVACDKRNVLAQRTRSLQEIDAPTEHPVAVEDTWSQVQRRGAEPRYWEDVDVGEVLPTLPKGTYSLKESAAFTVGYGFYLMLPEGNPDHNDIADLDPVVTALLSKHDFAGAALRFREPNELSNNRIFRVRAETAITDEYGAPGLYDSGEQRSSWQVQFITDWIGDHGYLRSYETDNRGFVMVGDTIWINGVVTGKREQLGEHLVDLDFWVENHRGRRVSTSSASVALPSKSSR